jgi:hypothetical protein
VRVPVHSIAELLASGSRPSWQESVALVQEIASQLAPGQPVPAVDDLLLSEDGTLSFGFAGESPRPQVTDLAELLASLLAGSTAPVPLVDLAKENSKPEPAHPTLEGFRSALAFYERPNRRADVAAVAGRLAARAEGDRARELVAQLRQRALAEPEPEPSSSPAALPKPAAAFFHTHARQFQIAGGLVLVALLGGAALRAGVLSGSPVAPNSPLPERTPPVAPARDAVVDSPVAASGTGTPAEPAREPAATDEAESTGRNGVGPAASKSAIRSTSGTRPAEHAPGTVRQPAAASRPAIATRTATARIPANQPERPEPPAEITPVPRPLPVPRAPAQPSRSADTDAFGIRGGLSDGVPVYSREDPDVKPPRILRQQLPSAPAPNAQTGYLEFVVDTQGNVESLNLISPTTRFHDLMLVAAAKAWKFRPAVFDGRPVKYRMRVAITLDGPPE